MQDFIILHRDEYKILSTGENGLQTGIFLFTQIRRYAKI